MLTSPATIRQSDAGYTLLEMLVVIAIIVMVVGSVPAIYSKVVPAYQVRQYANALAYSLRQQRDAARVSGTIRTVSLDQPPATLASVEGGVPEDVQLGFEPEPLWQSDDTMQIRFFPSGASTGGTVIVRRQNLEISILVDWMSGAVEVVQ